MYLLCNVKKSLDCPLSDTQYLLNMLSMWVEVVFAYMDIDEKNIKANIYEERIEVWLEAILFLCEGKKQTA